MKKAFLFAIVCCLCSISAFAQDTFVSLGSGGGFAGTATVYKVTPNGLVFKGDGVGDIKFTLCGKIKRSRAKQIIAEVNQQTQSLTEFSHPGNLYYFIALTDHEDKKTITWGDADHPVPAEIKKLYEEVHASVSALEYKPME
jgi:hypothetical protein